MRIVQMVLVLALSGCLGLALVIAGLAAELDKKKKTGFVVPAQSKPVTVSREAEEVADLALAFSLIQRGRQNKSPETLIVAAGILSKISMTPAKEKLEKGSVSKGTGDKGGDEGERPVDHRPPDNRPAALLAEARRMSGDDATIVTLADRIAKSIEEPRGPVGGTKQHEGDLDPGEYVKPQVQFKGGEKASVVVFGQEAPLRAGFLELSVADDSGSLVRSGWTDRHGLCLIEWYPEKTATFTIAVVNRGKQKCHYYLATN